MDEVRGRIKKVIYRQPETGFAILLMDSQDRGSISLKGTLAGIEKGQSLTAAGRISVHPSYGPQMTVSQYTIEQPDKTDYLVSFLGSGCIPGIGESLAARIVEAFGEDTLRIMTAEPERLEEIKGISERMARGFAAAISSMRDLTLTVPSIMELGIGVSVATAIFEEYGVDSLKVLSTDPYRLLRDIEGLGFETVDALAIRCGLPSSPRQRMAGYMMSVLMERQAMGHTCTQERELIETAALRLDEGRDEAKDALDMLLVDGLAIRDRGDEGDCIFTPEAYEAESEAARLLLELDFDLSERDKNISEKLRETIEASDLEVTDAQRDALLMAAGRGVSIITGGPGTGKTSIIKLLLAYFDRNGTDVLLAAPTGRAARRMRETTGYEASTIHRLLEINGDGEMCCDRNADNPLDADAVIIDEMSMADIFIFRHLLRAMVPGMRLILLGDENQLPSVGPGCVLADLIRSDAFSVKRLDRVFRQHSRSAIIENAHLINEGEAIDLTKDSPDFKFFEVKEIPDIRRCIIEQVRHVLPRELGCPVYDIQVMTPMKNGELGVEGLNILLREAVGPGKDAPSLTFGGQTLRQGDKVMQIKNNYRAVWRIFSASGDLLMEGSGVYNGDTGIVASVNVSSRSLTVCFDENRMVEYSGTALSELALSYAITVHKSQGGEFPAVVLPLAFVHDKLMNRNLLYTAVTRARDRVVIIGHSRTVQLMIAGKDEAGRLTQLKERIDELKGIISGGI